MSRVWRDQSCSRSQGEPAGALLEPHVSPVKFTGRPTSEFVSVDAAGIDAEADLARWVDTGADHAASRPPK